MRSQHLAVGAAVTAGALLSALLPAQASWTRLAPTTSPSARNNHVMCTDTNRKVTVLYGSQGNNETWEWDGKNWTKMNPTNSPPGSGYSGLSYDSARQVCVLFGGRTATTVFNETWEWDGKNWTQIKTPNSPGIRFGHAQCYDPRRNVTVVFGGYKNTLPYWGDTWEYDGKDWKQVATTGPVGRIYPYMEFDFLGGRSVLFSGYAYGAQPAADIQDTWEWDGKTWTEIKLACQPPARWGHAMTYVLPRGIIMFGGQKQFAPNNGMKQDTWLYNGKRWSEIKPTGAPSPRYLPDLAVDPTTNKAILFGGIMGGGETHSFDFKNFAPASYEPYGAGCKGSNGTPVLGSLNCNQPFLTETFTAQVTNIPTAAKVYLIFGTSRSTWNSNNLPMDWSVFGFTGCSLYASLNFFITMSTSGNTATLALPLPNDSNLVNATFYNQAFVFDSSANSSGATLSNAVTGFVGRR